MIDPADQGDKAAAATGARPSRVVVVYRCGGQNYTVTLNAAKVPVLFFDRARRDEIWQQSPPAHGGDVVVLDALDWSEAEHVVLEGPGDTDEPAHSGDCFCFEDDVGRRYCVCGMR